MDAPVATGEYEYLGRKTLWLFILNRSRVALIFLLAAGGLFFLSANNDLPVRYDFGAFAVNLHDVVGLGVLISFVAFLVALGIAILVGWLVYSNYRFHVGEDALKIRRGVLNKEEIAIPFRQIQDVTIVRDLSYQMWGLSKLVIQTAGQDANNNANEESEGVLPAVDKKFAEGLQSELLKKANIEKTTPANQ